VQDVVLIALILRFSGAPGWVAGVVFGSLAALSAWLLSPACPPPMLAALQASTILTMALGSRLPQIILNWRRGNAGMLSVMSCGLNVAGNAARIFTTLVLTRDPLLLAGILTQGEAPHARPPARAPACLPRAAAPGHCAGCAPARRGPPLGACRCAPADASSPL
jgi:hypothetical protein